jgi:ribonuclease T1
MRAAALGFLFLCTVAVAFSGDIRVAELPAEARHLLALIRAGGPFAYARDGAVFSNREGELPKRKRGYYREYTVKTPGSGDRGPRRIVAGEGGELYYTADHYRSFRRIIQ